MEKGPQTDDATEVQAEEKHDDEIITNVRLRPKPRVAKKGFSKGHDRRHWKQKYLECHRDLYHCMNILSRHLRVSIQPDGRVYILPKWRENNATLSKDASTISSVSEGSGSSHTESPIPATPNSEEAMGAEVSEQPTKAETHVEKSPEKSKRDTERVLVKRMAAALRRLGRLTLLAMLRLVKCLILAMLGLVQILWLVIKNGIVLRVIAFCELVGDCAYFLRKCSVPTLKGIYLSCRLLKD